jgi:hypothetical protein
MAKRLGARLSQLDLFQRVIPALARRYRVYALDLPGHGHSGIPAAEYTAELFIETVAGFLQQLESLPRPLALEMYQVGNGRVTTGGSCRWCTIGRRGKPSGSGTATSAARSCYSMVTTTGPRRRT